MSATSASGIDDQAASWINLQSLQSSVNRATRRGFQYGKTITEGDWDLVFSPPHMSGLLPNLVSAHKRN